MGSTGVRIAIDAMGGDHAPDEIVAGALRAREELGVKILLVGDPQRIEAVIPPNTNMADLEIVPAKEAIAMDEEPLNAVRRKRESSINIAMDLVKNKRADAVFSAGHSGAAMASALLRLGRLPGID
ncbi:MAG: phosphate acyltransferase, partial [Dolichospermum sp.]